MKHDLIVGASGSVGSLVAAQLARQGVQVHALTSKRERAGSQDGTIRWIFADLKSGEGVSAAFEGIDRAFIFAPPGYVPQNMIVSPLIHEAACRKLEKVVLLTALGANAVDTAPLRVAELELERSGLAYNIVRPNWFMQNFNTFWIQGINEQGKILLPVGKAKGSFIDVRDIAEVVVRLLTSHDLDHQAFDMTGSQSLDQDEVATILSRVSGRAIAYQEIPPGVMKQRLIDAGAPEDYSGCHRRSGCVAGLQVAPTPSRRDSLLSPHSPHVVEGSCGARARSQSAPRGDAWPGAGRPAYPQRLPAGRPTLTDPDGREAEGGHPAPRDGSSAPDPFDGSVCVASGQHSGSIHVFDATGLRHPSSAEEGPSRRQAL